VDRASPGEPSAPPTQTGFYPNCYDDGVARSTEIREIASAKHPLLKEIRRALRRGERTTDGLLPVETPHLLEEAIAAGLSVESALFTAALESQVRGLLKATTVRYRVHADALRGISSTEAPQGLLALVRPREWLAHNLFAPAPALVVMLAGIQDPGNAGTILRSAEAFGATGALLLRGTVHPENSKLVRAAAGSSFRLPHLAAVQLDQALALAALHGAPIYALDPRAKRTIDQVDLAKPCLLAVGAEGAGISPDLLEQATAVSVPRVRRVESLNAAVAAALALAEAARQRAAQPH